MKKRTNIDWAVVIPTLILILCVTLGLIVEPIHARNLIQKIYDVVVDEFGWLYLLACILSFALLLWVTFSKFGNVKLGGMTCKPAYKEFEWASMLFCSGVGSGVVILGFMEPLYYLSSTPFGIDQYSTEAYEFAHMYGQFHWGPSAWAFYIPAIIAVSMIVYKKKEPALRLSVVTKHLGKGNWSNIIGKILDVFVQFGIVAGISTSLGLAVPVISLLISQSLGIPNNMILKIGIIIIWIAIFTFSVYRGLDKGIKLLSNTNMVLLLVFAIIVLFMTGISSTFKMELNSLGLYFQNFVRMNTWLDPFGSGDFQKMWTIFYWGWWLTFMPMMALFIVRISKGRSLKRVIWMQLIWGSLGCWCCFMIFGGYSLKIQQSGILDLASILQNQGQNIAIVEMLKQMPFSSFMIILFCVLLFIFLATCIDSAAYVLSSGSVRRLEIDEQPSRGYRVFWAAVLAILSIALLVIDQLKAVQTLSLIAGLPLIAVQIYMCYASIKLLKNYKNKEGVFKVDKENI